MTALSRLRDWFSVPLGPTPPAVERRPAHRFQGFPFVAPPTVYPGGSPLGTAAWPNDDPAKYGDAYRSLPLVFRCINLVSHAASVAPVRVYDEDADDEEIPNHPLRRLIRQPNPVMGEAAFWRTVAKRAAVAGFCVVEKERDRLGRVIALNPLNSAWAKAIPLGLGRFAWEYRVPGVSTVYALKAEDAIAFRWTEAPDGSPYGVAPLGCLTRDVALIAKLQDFLGVLLARGGVPLYGLIPDVLPGATLDQDQADELLAAFLARHGGIERAGIPLVLEGVKDVKRLGFDLDELAYTDLRDVSELDIAQAFGVPPTKAMIRVGLEHSDSRANAEVDDQTFYRDTVVPLWASFDDALTTGLLPDFETLPTAISLQFDTSGVAALQEDRTQRAPWLIQGFTGGAFSQHTLYRELGLPQPDTDDFYLRGLGTEAIPADDPLLLDREGPVGTLPPPLPVATLPPSDGTGEAAALLAWPSGPAVRLAAGGPTARRAHQKIARNRQPSIAAFFRAEGKRVLAVMGAQGGAPPVGVGLRAGESDASTGTMNRGIIARSGPQPPGPSHRGRGEPDHVLALSGIDWQRENRELESVLSKLYHLAGRAAFALASDQLGVGLAFDLANPRIRDATDALADRVVAITEESRRLIAAAVTAANQRGATVDELRDDLASMFSGWSEHRAATVARTESLVSFGTASKLAYQQSGIVDRIQCFDNPDHGEDYGAEDGLSCAERNGLIDALDSADLHLGSEHPNGSLSISPVLIGEEA